MAARGPDKTRRSRITAACAVCRAKRQKCSGQKPVCDQCRSHHEECWWSDQKKRGPAKDYLRSLQDRLQDTERLLIGVLNHVSDETLLDVMQHTETSAAAPSHQIWASALSGQEYWSQFPMSGLETVREWQRHRQSGETRNAPFPSNGTRSQRTAQQPSAIDPSIDSSMVTESVHAVGSGGPYYHELHRDQFAGNGGWSQNPQPQRPPNERRYSEETRDVAQALYSISNHVEAPPQQQQPQPPEPPPTGNEKPTVIAGPDPLSSENFSKEIFW